MNFGGVFDSTRTPAMTKAMELGVAKLNAYVVELNTNTIINVEMVASPNTSKVTRLPFTTLASPAAVEWTNHREVVAVAMNGKQLFFSTSDNDQAFTAWSQAGSFPAPSGICGDPSAVSWGPGRVDVLVLACDGDIMQGTHLNNAWNWASRGPGFNSSRAPVASSPDGARLDVWMPISGQIEDDQYNGSGWTGREASPLTGMWSIASSPIHANGGNNVISGAVVGLDLDGQLVGLGDDMWASHGFAYAPSSNINGWGWPSTATFSPNSIVVYGLDAQQHIARTRLSFSGFTPQWNAMSNNLGGPSGQAFAGRVGVIAGLTENGSEPLFVFAITPSGNLYFSLDTPS
jgi:hypothetical protein